MAGLKKIKSQYTLNPAKSKNNLMDWKQVGEDARNIGFGALDYGTFMFAPALPMLTGKTSTDLLEGAGVKTYTNSGLGSKFAKASDVAGNAVNSLLPLATGIAGQAIGVPMPIGTAVGQGVGTLGKNLSGDMGATQRFEQEELKKQQQQDMYKFGKGGLNSHKTVINVEKGELLADPKTGEIIEHYNDVPKHPEGKHEIDLRGNVEAPVGYAVIPANMANQFKNAKPEERLKMIQTLPGFSGMKQEIGTGSIGFDYNNIPQSNTIQSLNPVGQQTIQGSGMYMQPQDFQSQQLVQGDNNANMNYAVGAAIAPQMGFGLYQAIAANKALKKLGKEPYAMYNEQVQPELQQSYGAAQGRATDASLRSRYGLSQAQQAMYNQNVARDINTRMQRAQDIGGGNVGQVVGNIMNANKIQAAQQQSALDAQLQMQKQQYADRAAQYAEGLAQRIAAARQGQQNQNTAFQQQLRLQKERAYGLAKQRGFENTMNAPMQAASILGTYYGGK